MWNISEIESTDSNTKFTIKENGESISNKHFLNLLRDTEEFRVYYNDLLAECGYDAFFWENRPVTHQSLDENYECNLIRSNYLATKMADTNTFSQYFDESKNVVTFNNLGNDARLIAPCPAKNNSGYPHIGTFVREADREQVDDFWKITAEEMLAEIGNDPKWLSTSGLGVFWLHARVDSIPKYYQTKEYKSL